MSGLEVIERWVVPRTPGRSAEDVIVTTESFVGVFDGVSSDVTPDDPPGRRAAQCLAAGLASLEPSATAIEALEVLTQRLRGEAGWCADMAASGAILSVHRREVWRVGDVWVSIDGAVKPSRLTPERLAAPFRALVNLLELAEGRPVDAVNADDSGRQAIIGVLRRANRTLRADHADKGRPACARFDGLPLSPHALEIVSVPSVRCEVVLATDGYPVIAADLTTTEALLQARLRRDPLMIEYPPATKGVASGANSFDDRAYVRVRL